MSSGATVPRGLHRGRAWSADSLLIGAGRRSWASTCGREIGDTSAMETSAQATQSVSPPRGSMMKKGRSGSQ